ncbi:MAG: asparagine synthase (glutamine-hydrolyzing) [Candidatus Eisenbacteria bacterium]|nr:asparagine synthase (glutamine-hydrolyzing) [Candidatus Eisenbacteria bacterium]
MCGIFGGYVRSGALIPESLLSRMGDRIAHRGPDDSGVHQSEGIAVGNRRLSIIDLAGGHQPMSSEDARVIVVQNGEIYNFVELAEELAREGIICRTKSDTEVILQLYLRYGIDFVSKLNGMFAIAIHDRRTDVLWLVRDRIGVKPLFVHDDGSRLLFASEVKSLIAAGISPVPNWEAIHHYLTFNYVPPPLTAYRGITQLPPGCMLEIRRDRVDTRVWWKLCDVQPETLDIESWKSCFLSTLDDAVRLRLRADVPFGAFLSGGLDSSTVVGMMSRHLPEPVRTFSIGFDDPRYDESAFAGDAAARFGTQHTLEVVAPNLVELWPLAIWHCDQPHGDVSFLPMRRLSELAVKSVKMVLTGDGGDEFFGGYLKYVDFFRRYRPEGGGFSRAYHAHISLLDEAAKRRLYSPEMTRLVSALDSFELTAEHLNAVPHQDRVNQALYLDAMLLLPGNNLVKPDRMTMSVSLEGRNPFLDARVMELAFRMPGSLKVRDGETRWLYKQAVEPLLGGALTHRKKQMFTVPIGEWFKQRLRPLTHGLLLSSGSLLHQMFSRHAVESLLTQHEAGVQNYTREIRALLAIELWLRVCVAGSFEHPPSLDDLGLPPA